MAAVLSACGSTLPEQTLEGGAGSGPGGEQAAFGGDGQGGAVGADGTVGGTGGGGTGGGAAGTGGAAGGTATGPNATTRTGRTGTTTPGKKANAKGVTDTTIKVGLWYYDAAAANFVVGGASGNPDAFYAAASNPEKAARAVVDDINKRGGIAGRKVVPVIHKVDITKLSSDSGYAEEVGRACAKWTQDNQVFAFQALVAGGGMDCAKTSKTAIVGDVSNTDVLDQGRYRQYSDVWFNPVGLVTERKERAMVDSLWENGFFTQGGATKVAVMMQEVPGAKAGVNNALVPALKGKGVNSVMVIPYPDPIDSPWGTYIQTLKDNTINHVIFATTSGVFWAPSFMMKQASAQTYTPKWAMGSDAVPDYLYSVSGVQADQLRNAQGIGWLPLADVGDLSPQSPNDAQCDKIGAESAQGRSTDPYCEMLYFLKAALDKAPEVSLAGLSQGLDALGDTYKAVKPLGGYTSFSADNHLGASTYRHWAFDTRPGKCTPNDKRCFAYKGPEKRFP